jgi:hypothetical protein
MYISKRELHHAKNISFEYDFKTFGPRQTVAFHRYLKTGQIKGHSVPGLVAGKIRQQFDLPYTVITAYSCYWHNYTRDKDFEPLNAAATTQRLLHPLSAEHHKSHHEYRRKQFESIMKREPTGYLSGNHWATLKQHKLSSNHQLDEFITDVISGKINSHLVVLHGEDMVNS